MRLKVLTVDDSRAVRIIVKKTFTTYDVEILEAANGVEGLAAASKESPDLILLDVTMPVMDGVEMLTKMKADPALKNIPVIMLTAEAGRESVLKIAKIGIRDYIVKPFKEEVLIEKAGRIIDLRPVGDGSNKRKSISDPCDILVLEDKPAIIKQIEDGLAKLKQWKVHGVTTPGETIDYCCKQIPDVIIISLSLPEDAAVATFRLLRSNVKTKYVPVFGLAVKTATDEQQQAQQAGFTAVITKPIDFDELESKISKAINLDTSERYFVTEEQFFIVRLPAAYTTNTLNEIAGYLKMKISSAVDSGVYRIVLDMSAAQAANMDVIKLIHDAMTICKEMTLANALVSNEGFAKECRNFEESKDWKLFNSLADAKASFKS